MGSSLNFGRAFPDSVASKRPIRTGGTHPPKKPHLRFHTKRTMIHAGRLPSFHLCQTSHALPKSRVVLCTSVDPFLSNVTQAVLVLSKIPSCISQTLHAAPYQCTENQCTEKIVHCVSLPSLATDFGTEARPLHIVPYQHADNFGAEMNGNGFPSASHGSASCRWSKASRAIIC